ncbi:MAG: hypothetical protein K2G55_13925 [Lachnospiraceae bacterium]|nr:hypothetical protein [Lachnospiraceae bacterium]MDE7204415.1 hypothetical protein [Lachnospiraceae bacterium]
MGDWKVVMRPLKKQRGLSWYNRLGPLVVCFFLDMKAYSIRYYPEYSVHNLCREFPCLTATLRFMEEEHNIHISEELKEYRSWRQVESVYLCVGER